MWIGNHLVRRKGDTIELGVVGDGNAKWVATESGCIFTLQIQSAETLANAVLAAIETRNADTEIVSAEDIRREAAEATQIVS